MVDDLLMKAVTHSLQGTLSARWRRCDDATTRVAGSRLVNTVQDDFASFKASAETAMLSWRHTLDYDRRLCHDAANRLPHTILELTGRCVSLFPSDADVGEDCAVACIRTACQVHSMRETRLLA